MLGKLQEAKLNHLFIIIDANNDDAITGNDFSDYIGRFATLNGIEPDSHRYDRLSNDILKLWNSIRDVADKNDDNQVSSEEWLTYWNSWADAVADEAIRGRSEKLDKFMEAAKFQMSMLDGDDDGLITPEEYGRAIQAWGRSVELEEVFPRLDLNEDGTITSEEVAQLVREFYLSNDPAAPGNFLYGPPY